MFTVIFPNNNKIFKFYIKMYNKIQIILIPKDIYKKMKISLFIQFLIRFFKKNFLNLILTEYNKIIFNKIKIIN
jgi:hypothetical protein